MQLCRQMVLAVQQAAEEGSRSTSRRGLLIRRGLQ
jgi:hypothetical protein